MTVSKSFTAPATTSGLLSLKPNDSLTYDVSGTYTGVIVLEATNSPTTGFSVLRTGTTGQAFSGTLTNESKGSLWYRFRAQTLGSGTAVTELADYDNVLREVIDSQGNVVVRVRDSGLSGQGVAVLRSRLVLTNDEIKASPTAAFIPIIPGVACEIIVPESYSRYFDWAANYTNIKSGATFKLGYEGVDPVDAFAIELSLDPSAASFRGLPLDLSSFGDSEPLDYNGAAFGLYVDNGVVVTGQVATATPSGTALAISNTIVGIPLSNSGSGASADFTINDNGAGGYTVVAIVNNYGDSGVGGYQVGDVLVFSGEDLGGATPANDLTLTIASISTRGINFTGGNAANRLALDVFYRLADLS